jgi:hypothetical protein
MERVKQSHERDVVLFWISIIQRALESGCAVHRCMHSLLLTCVCVCARAPPRVPPATRKEHNLPSTPILRAAECDSCDVATPTSAPRKQTASEVHPPSKVVAPGGALKLANFELVQLAMLCYLNGRQTATCDRVAFRCTRAHSVSFPCSPPAEHEYWPPYLWVRYGCEQCYPRSSFVGHQ